MASLDASTPPSGAPLRIDIITLFPEMFAPVIGLSIVGRAVEAGLVAVYLHNPLDALEKSERADDTPYGGGPGMIMRLAPLVRILDALITEERAAQEGGGTAASDAGAPPPSMRFILTSPAGRQFAQSDAQRWSLEQRRLIMVCGHYEGIDDRLCALYPFEEISMGDFILTGGEIPALAMLDAVVRLQTGVLNAQSLVDESFTLSGLEYPAYTRPARFRGIDVPAVLLSGDHAAIAQWRRQQSRDRTRLRRADLGVNAPSPTNLRNSGRAGGDQSSTLAKHEPT